MKRLLAVSFCLAIALVVAQRLPSLASLDSRTYDNLMRSRDALLAQEDYLKKAQGVVGDQISALQDKQSRINDYLRQNEDALRDINTALSQAGD